MPVPSNVAMIRSDVTLTTFLCHAVAANRAEHKTLTLITPQHVVLQPSFFCDLAEAWKSLREKLALGSDVMLRVDCCHDDSRWQLFAAMSQQWDLLRCRRAFRRMKVDDAISLTRCLVVGRPVDASTSIVLGIAEPNVTLPDWVKAAPMSLPA